MFPRHVYRRTVVSVIEQINNACWSSTKWKSSLSHRNIICSRHNIPKKIYAHLALNNNHSLTYMLCVFQFVVLCKIYVILIKIYKKVVDF